jgi:hypothetical protein
MKVTYDTICSKQEFLKMSEDAGKAALLVPKELKTSVGYAAGLLEIMSHSLPDEKN